MSYQQIFKTVAEAIEQERKKHPSARVIKLRQTKENKLINVALPDLRQALVDMQASGWVIKFTEFYPEKPEPSEPRDFFAELQNAGNDINKINESHFNSGVCFTIEILDGYEDWYANDARLKMTDQERSNVIKKNKQPSISDVPKRSKKELADQKIYKYKGWDILKFLSKRGKYGSYYIKINKSKHEKIPAAEIWLLIFFAQKLRKDKMGWVTREDAEKAKVTDPNYENHFDALLHELRNKIGHYLKTCKREKFLETNKKQFRISTHPGRVIVPHNRWLSKTFNEIKSDLLKKRKKKGGEQSKDKNGDNDPRNSSDPYSILKDAKRGL